MRRIRPFIRACSFAGLLLCGAVGAQTEDDLLRYVESHRPQMESGTLAPLDFYKEVHRRIAVIPAASYGYKAENLRMIGERIDWYEDVRAGKMTREKAERLVIEQRAGSDVQEAARQESGREQAQREFDARIAAAARQREQRQAVEQQVQQQQEELRRQAALQFLMNQRPSQPYQLQPPYQMPIQRSQSTNCIANGNQLNCTTR